MKSISSYLSENWKSLSEADRKPFEQSASKDRERYEQECLVRDEEIAKMQEEKRLANKLIDVDSSEDLYTRRGDLKVID